ncbi:MAG: hypothetical protein JSS61_02845 [Verrucomicrobia bacterium]|nr:hypothetical protein [Verrucomicrobiota bacterium]
MNKTLYLSAASLSFICAISAVEQKANAPTASASFLYWNANQDGLEYAAEYHVNSSQTVYKGSDLDIRENWNPGFRLGLGWLFGHYDEWALTLDWTYYYSKARRTRSSSDFQSKNFAPHWSAILGPIASSAKADWSMHFNTLDLSLSREYSLSKRISCRPFMGLRGAWIDQNYKTNYDGVWEFITNFVTPSYQRQPTSMKADLDFKALGLRAGGDLVWHFCKNWGLFGKAAGSLLYGKFDVTERFKGYRPNTGVGSTATLTPVFVTLDDNYHRARVNLEASGGIQWGTDFCKGKYHVSLGASWEISYWFDQNQLFQIAFSRDSRMVTSTTAAANDDLSTVRQDGDLAFQGVTFNIDLHF